MKEKSFRHAPLPAGSDHESSPQSPMSPGSPQTGAPSSFLGISKSNEGRKMSTGVRRQTLNIMLSPEKLPELKGMASSSIVDIRSRLNILSIAFTNSQDMDEAVKYARMLSQSRKVILFRDFYLIFIIISISII
jgi:hypothetical protein